ncbi:hypothetical protein MNO14_01675 [Luteimonas sp. S4-F44]|uniref:hypothetical protein n=1 Tax=Luteimonas sp. S4-F44 TaxID=2925842 RepID=UPI001F53567D|nr:hypothetical protein [Luteimonas sp. S4-F44]UNK42844.1 hypothetical protein MNO14_01675 [Luteimonas sp. S4-F44]
MDRWTLRGVALLAAWLPAFAGHAADANANADVWLGSGWDGPVPHAVRLQLTPGGGELRLGAPWACRLPLKREGTGYTPGLSVNGGTACDRLSGRRLTVQVDGQRLRLDGLSLTSLTLRPAGDAATASGARTLALSAPGDTAVELRLVAAALGERSGEWRQGGATPCRAVLELAAVDTGQQWHVFTAGTSGGGCDRWVGRTVVLPSAPGAAVTVRGARGADVVLSPK